MKKFFSAILLFLFAFLVWGSLKTVFAGHYGGALLQGNFENKGNIPVTVTYTLSDPSGVFYSNPGTAVGGNSAVGFIKYDISSPTYSPPYTLNWWSSCVPDPQVTALDQSIKVVSGGHTYDLFTFPTQNVTCPSVGGEPIIISAVCSSNLASFSYTLSGAGPYNLSHWWVFLADSEFRVLNSPWMELNTNVPASQTSYTFGTTLSPSGTYWVRVNAKSLPGAGFPNGSTSSPAWTSVTCSAPPPSTVPANPSNLYIDSLPCFNTGSYSVTFHWTLSGGTTNWEFRLLSNGFPQPIYDKNGQPHDPWSQAGSDGSWSFTIGPLSVGNTYTWYVRAGNAVGWTVWVSGPSFSGSYCPGTVGGKKIDGLGNPFTSPGATVTLKDWYGNILGSWGPGIATFSLSPVASQVYLYFSSTLPSGYVARWSVCQGCAAPPATAANIYTGGNVVILVPAGSSSYITWRYSLLSEEKPDFTTVSLELLGTLDGFNMVAGGPMSARLNFKNQGLAPATTDFTVDIWFSPDPTTPTRGVCNKESGPYGPPTWSASYPASAAPAGAFITLNTPPTTAPSKIGFYWLWAHVDSRGPNAYCQVLETDELNNEEGVLYNIVCPTAPGAPTLISPTGNINDPRPTFKWSAGSPNTATTYRLEISKDNFATFSYEDIAAPSTELVYPNGSTNFWDNNAGNIPHNTIDKGVRYYWRVRAINSCGQSSTPSATFNYIQNYAGWIEVTGADVGVVGSINILNPGPPAGCIPPCYNSHYAVLYNGPTSGFDSVSNFSSERNWLIDDSANNPAFGGEPNTFDELFERLSPKITDRLGLSCPWTTVTGSNRVVQCLFPNYTSTSGAPQFSDNLILIAPSNFTIDADLILSSSQSLLVVAMGKVRVKSTVNRIDGIFFAQGGFDDAYDVATPPASVSAQFVVNGSIISQQTPLFKRTFSNPNTNDTTPVELIRYQPRFMVNLQNLLGTPFYKWEEVAP